MTIRSKNLKKFRNAYILITYSQYLIKSLYYVKRLENIFKRIESFVISNIMKWMIERNLHDSIYIQLWFYFVC